MKDSHLEGGFADPPVDAAHAFRAVMEAMARPGTIQPIAGARPPAPLGAAAGAVLLTLCDGDTPLYLAGAADCEEVRTWVAFHTGAPLCGPREAAFALGTWEALMPLDAYPIGTETYPDRSATLIVDGAALSAEGARLTGPGIRDEVNFGLPDIKLLQRNHALFPLGLDFIFCSGSDLAALPRSTEIH